MATNKNERQDLIDLSHTIEHGLITYPGLPGPVISDFWSREQSSQHYDRGVSFHIGTIEMVGNTGTYVDSPFHRYANGKDLSDLPLEKLANLEGVVVRVDVGNQRGIGADHIRGIEIVGRAVLIQTGWSAHWGKKPYFEGHPFLTAEAALYLRDAGATLVGIDSLNIDDTSGGQRPVHSILLEAEIPIVEHLTNLDLLPASSFHFFAVPLKVKELGSFPVRAFAIVHN